MLNYMKQITNIKPDPNQRNHDLALKKLQHVKYQEKNWAMPYKGMVFSYLSEYQ